ncbi:MAG TPA: adenosylhomocysteinase [Gaiellaceae bacterium]|nr:adenosylhomocysteinase [Gaiellaceae bacterium]
MSSAPELAGLEPSRIENAALADAGGRVLAWTRTNMPLLAGLRSAFERERPLEGRRIGMCLHVEAKTAVLVEVLRAGGAEVVLTGSPATTDDRVAALLAQDGDTRVYARKADTMDDHHGHVARVLASEPDLLLDNGADLIAATVAAEGARVTAATEETTSGRHRLLGELAGRIAFPVIVINDSPIKLLFENEHGIGPAVVDGFLRATNSLIAAKTFAVIGFGSCGRSLARTLRRLGASVVVVERDPVRALEAAFEGMRVTSVERAAELADVVITVTGRPGAVTTDVMSRLRDGAVLANVGHFSTEIDVPGLEQIAVRRDEVRDDVTAFVLPGGRTVYLLARGEMLNLAVASGHQIQIMDLGFALQAHSLRALAVDPTAFSHGYNPVPPEIDRVVAEEALATLSTVEREP